MSGKVKRDAASPFTGGVSLPFKQLNNNFLPIFGLFGASFVFLFTCMAVSPLHYMYNVTQQNGCFPLLFPSFLPFFPSLPFLSLPFPSSGVFWVGLLGRSRKIPEDPSKIRGRSRKIPEDPRKIRTDPSKPSKPSKPGLYLRLY